MANRFKGFAEAAGVAAVAAALLLGLFLPAAAQEVDIAVVVHPDVPIADLTFAEVRKIMLGERQFWTPGLRVTLLMRAPVARERDVVLKRIFQMSEAQFRQYWIGKVFRAEASGGPKIVYSNEMATQLIAMIPGSVAMVEYSGAAKNLRVLKIDGKLPGEKGYALR